MRKLTIILLFLVIVAVCLTDSKNNKDSVPNAKIKTKRPSHKKSVEKSLNERNKRSLKEEDKFQSNKHSEGNVYGSTKVIEGHKREQIIKTTERDRYWPNRGRRGSSEENLADSYEYDKAQSTKDKDYDAIYGMSQPENKNEFWGNHGRSVVNENIIRSSPNIHNFWGIKGEGNDDLFWPNYGRGNRIERYWDRNGKKEYVMQRSLKRHFDGDFLTDRAISDEFDNNKPLYYSYLKNNKINKKAEDFNSAKTFYDEDIYAEQPNYILVDRSGRSSREADPYFISRGKKIIHDFDWIKAARDRRGHIVDIYKTVKSDPYFIARGKKGSVSNKTNQALITKELVCSTVEMFKDKKAINTKRETNENDRNRRTVLKVLQEKLQLDPYIVSRGKKGDFNSENTDDVDFINIVTEMCAK